MDLCNTTADRMFVPPAEEE